MATTSSADDRTPRGAGVVRHTAQTREFEPAGAGEPDTLEAIERHVESHFGPIVTVWHEIVSDLVHVDVHVVEPSADRPYYTLVTSGMSDRPMTVPPDADCSRFAELMLCLPADWPLTANASTDERAYWPIRLLKTVARLPHEYETWIAEWHSMPNGDPAEPYAPGTQFVGVVVVQMIHCAPEAREIITDSGRRISLLALVPLHPAEMILKLTGGTGALIDALDRARITEVLDPARPSSV
jgi:hypothetical protein